MIHPIAPAMKIQKGSHPWKYPHICWTSRLRILSKASIMSPTASGGNSDSYTVTSFPSSPGKSASLTTSDIQSYELIYSYHVWYTTVCTIQYSLLCSVYQRPWHFKKYLVWKLKKMIFEKWRSRTRDSFGFIWIERKCRSESDYIKAVRRL